MNWKGWLIRLRLKKRPEISILMPFTSDESYRQEAFKWLKEYWKYELPDAEFIVGRSNGKPFVKTEALNHAAKRANGKVFVVLDADALLSGPVLEICAKDILEALKYDHRIWYVPYRNLYRLNKNLTRALLRSDPKSFSVYELERITDQLDTDPHESRYGKSYAAMAYVIPREALKVIGCFDERFDKGWGGEDVSTLKALDTLWGKHKTTNNYILHFWHPKLGSGFKNRAWEGQQGTNSDISMRYYRAGNDPAKMRQLVLEGCAYGKEKHKCDGRLGKAKCKIRGYYKKIRSFRSSAR